MRALLVTALLATPAMAGAEELYRVPPKAIADLVDAPLPPVPMLAPDGRTLLLAEQPGLPGIAEVAQPELRLAGLRINPRNNGPSRRSYFDRLTLLDLDSRVTRAVAGLPATPRIQDLAWSPDGKRLAFTLAADDAVRPWIVELATAQARPLGPDSLRLNGVFGGPCVWMPDSQGLFCRAVPADRGAGPPRDPTPRGPIAFETGGKKKPAPTWQDLLASPHDEALFEHHALAQAVRVGLDGQVVRVGAPALLSGAIPSPDGRWVLATVLHRPFSYRVPYFRFPYRIEVWDAAGKRVRLIADNPLADEVSVLRSAVPPGPREPEWRGDTDATVCWAEALDGGDPTVKADLRDELRCLSSPFSSSPRRLIALELRFAEATWGSGKLALVSEWWWDTRKTRTHAISPDDPAAKPRVLWDRSFEDRYSDPGTPLVRLSPRGTYLLLVSRGNTLLLNGSGASPEGDRPFLDRLQLDTFATTRLWRSEAPHYERVLDTVDDAGSRVLSMREAVTEPPQVYLRGLPGKLEKLTSYPHPTPALAKVQKQQLRYKRADGLELNGMLWLPPGFDPKQRRRLPLLLWAYPQEFKSGDAAGQVKDSPYRFARIGYWGPLFALTMGFAVLDNPSFPIVGEGTAEPNDTYREQLVADARAAIDEVVRLGVADRDRVAIGGHSYGAFTTANLLAHSDLFRAGIARSGAYNRTLTPFTFQNEQRTFWQAQAAYIEMSPFTHADKIDEPLLIIHGQADNNQGTFPMQSERLFEALQGLGGKARLVMLPAEAHGYRGRESVLHMLWEMHNWLEIHVKRAGPRESTAAR